MIHGQGDQGHGLGIAANSDAKRRRTLQGELSDPAAGGASGAVGIGERAVRTCSSCGAKSTPGTPWNKYEVHGQGTDGERRVPTGEWCEACPLGLAAGQFNISIAAGRERCATGPDFGQRLLKAGKQAKALGIASAAQLWHGQEVDANHECAVYLKQYGKLQSPEEFKQARNGVGHTELGLEAVPPLVLA